MSRGFYFYESRGDEKEGNGFSFCKTYFLASLQVSFIIAQHKKYWLLAHLNNNSAVGTTTSNFEMKYPYNIKRK